jgi:hypothetical protein
MIGSNVPNAADGLHKVGATAIPELCGCFTLQARGITVPEIRAAFTRMTSQPRSGRLRIQFALIGLPNLRPFNKSFQDERIDAAT